MSLLSRGSFINAVFYNCSLLCFVCFVWYFFFFLVFFFWFARGCFFQIKCCYRCYVFNNCLCVLFVCLCCFCFVLFCFFKNSLDFLFFFFPSRPPGATRDMTLPALRRIAAQLEIQLDAWDSDTSNVYISTGGFFLQVSKCTRKKKKSNEDILKTQH